MQKAEDNPRSSYSDWSNARAIVTRGHALQRVRGETRRVNKNTNNKRYSAVIVSRIQWRGDYQDICTPGFITMHETTKGCPRTFITNTSYPLIQTYDIFWFLVNVLNKGNYHCSTKCSCLLLLTSHSQGTVTFNL